MYRISARILFPGDWLVDNLCGQWPHPTDLWPDASSSTVTLEREVVSHPSALICKAEEAGCLAGLLPTVTKLPFAMVGGMYVSAVGSLSLGDVPSEEIVKLRLPLLPPAPQDH